MTIMTRLVRLLKADVHGVMDQFEDRGLLLRQSLREMETSLGQKEARLKALSGCIGRLTRQAARHREEMEKLDQDVDLALSKAKDDIARMLIRRHLALESAVGLLKAQIQTTSTKKGKLAEIIRDQKLRYETLKAQAETWQQQGANDVPGTSARSFAGDGDPTAIRDEEIELALIRRKEAFKKQGGPE